MNYQKIYDQIIERSKNRALQGYTEKHHIIPRCLGGDNEPSNLATLTAREHFLCHWLLSRMHPYNIRLAYAFQLMSKVEGRGQKRHIPSSKAIQEARERVSSLKKGKPNPNHSLKMKGRKQSKESVEKMMATRESKGLNKEHSKKMIGNKHAKGNAGRRQTAEEKLQRGLSQPNKKGCIVDGLYYSSISSAARELGLPQKTVWFRLRSCTFSNYNTVVNV